MALVQGNGGKAHAPQPETQPPSLKAESQQPSQQQQDSQQDSMDCVGVSSGERGGTLPHLPSTQSLLDQDQLAMLGSEALAEERRLVEERQHEAPKAPDLSTGGALDSNKFSKLEMLLHKSEQYTRFLMDQLGNMEQQCGVDAARYHATQKAAGAASAEHVRLQQQQQQQQQAASNSGGKRGRGGRGRGGRGGRGKRAREEAEAEPEEKGQQDQQDQPAKVAKSDRTATQELLPLLKADLRDYQLRGVKWLISCYQNGVNGILADEMGLGKTVQTLGFFSHLKLKGIHGPFMIVGPLSTLSNWIAETQRFLPSVKPLLYHGSKQDRAQLRAQHIDPKYGVKVPEDFPLIVTSYEILIADAKILQKMKFKYVVVDEGHRLKNFDCRLIRELRSIPTENRLLLTGTPLQNNLSELWSLLNFLMPEIFNSMADFESWFDFSASVGQQGANQEIVLAEQRNKVISKLHGILRPFVLRRLKSDVQISLPQKMEIILYAHMTETQRQLNRQMMDKTLLTEMQQLAARNGGNIGNVGKLNNMLMQMRKNCNHPDLITSAFSNDILFPPPDVLLQQCGKLQLLDRLLKELRAKGNKVLIFSQMTKMLDLIESYLEQLGIKVCRIDGSVPWQERQQNITSFNEDQDTWIFLLSTRAGGLGINLTAADTVIIYDSDWNPHQDMQAMDRCHRIGQQKPVLVLRLVTAHSVEGKMLKRAGDKMALERIVIKKGAFQDLGAGSSQQSADDNTGMSLAELQEMLQGTYKINDVPQSGEVSQEMLDTLLDRKHLIEHTPPPFPDMGVGYEVVHAHNTSGVLKDISGNPEAAT